MHISVLWRKFYRSWPGIFILETLALMYIVLAITQPKFNHINWLHLIRFSAVLGLLATLFAVYKARLTIKKFGVANRQQLLALWDTVNSSTIPEDKELLRVLPKYFLYCAELAEKNRKEAPRLIAFFSFFIIVTILAKLPWMGVVFAIFIIQCAYILYNFEIKKSKYEAYYAKLVAHGIKVYPDERKAEKPKENPKKPNSWGLPS